MIAQALARGWGDLLRPRIFGVVLLGIGLTLALFVALQAGLFWAIRALVPGGVTLPFFGPLDLGNALSWGSLALFPLMGFLLMAPVAAAFGGLFAEQVAGRVEAIHYPADQGQDLGLAEGISESVALFGAVIAVSLISLLALGILGPFAPVLFYGANGWLLGREFFQMAARRHLHAPQAVALRRANGVRVTLTGVAIAFLLTVPVLNIAVPVLAGAVFTHLFHLTARRPTDQGPADRRG